MELKPALQSSKGRSGPWAGSRLINAFAEQSEGDKAELFAVMAIPGLTEFSGNMGNLPMRGMHAPASVDAFNDFHVFAVVGSTLYTVSSAGAGSALGTIPGTNPVKMADNGTQIAIHDGDHTGYIWDTETSTLTVPVDLPDVSDVTFIDGYFVWSIADSDQFIISELDDGTIYDVLDVASAEGSPDELVAIVTDHRELLLFGRTTIEIWVNTGAADFPFERQGNAFIERGCVDKNSIVKMDNGVIFVDREKRVCRLDGYSPTRISTHAVEKTLAAASWFRAFTYSQEGHEFYVLNTDQGTRAHDVATGAWAERQSFGLDYYRVGFACQQFDRILLGSNQNGKIWYPDLDRYDEDGAQIPVIIELPPVGDGVARKTLYAFEVFMETGVGDLTTTDPQAILTYSKNGGRSWSNEMWRMLGAQGEYETRAVWRPTVEFRQLQLRLQMPDSVRRCAIGYHADVR